MDQKIINLYDTFTHGGMSRRDFLDRLAELAGSTAAEGGKKEAKKGFKLGRG